MPSHSLTILAHVRGPLAERVAAQFPEHRVVPIASKGDLADDVRGDVLLTLPWALANLPDVLGRGVRWVHVLGTGVDAFPLAALGDQILTCSRGGSAVPIAEWVLAMILACAKRIPQVWLHDSPGEQWRRIELGGLEGATVGLIGLGGIGRAVAERALTFGMRVRAVRRTAAPPPLSAIEIAPSLIDLVASADHIVVAAPATPATRHLLDGTVFAAVKPGAHLINVARGALVDQNALRTALDDGRIALASLDAVDPEPLPAGHWMYSHPHVRLSAHVSWSMPGAAERLLDAFLDNVRRYAAGEPLAGVVDRAERY